MKSSSEAYRPVSNLINAPWAATTARRQDLNGLLAQSEVLEGALETAYLEISRLWDEVALFHDDPAARLEGAVRAARVVESRLTEAAGPHSDDNLYLEAARDARASQ